MKKKVRMGKLVVFSTVVASTTAYITTKFLMQAAFNRELPENAEKAQNQIAGSLVDKNFLKAIEDGAIELEKIPVENIQTTAADGTPLVGHLYRCPNAKRTVIAMHGWRSTWTHDFGTVFKFWHEHNCNVLYAEQRGQCNSGGEYMGFGLLERFDCLDWANWINENIPEKLPIYLAGVSMGATTVLMASELPLPENVHGIIADCGFTSPDAIWRHVTKDNLHIPYGIKGMVVGSIYQKVTTFDPTYSTENALSKTKIPVLLVHGTDDHFVPIDMTYKNYKACLSPHRILVVPGAEHGMSYYTDPQRYEEAVLQFWNDYDNYTIC